MGPSWILFVNLAKLKLCLCLEWIKLYFLYFSDSWPTFWLGPSPASSNQTDIELDMRSFCPLPPRFRRSCFVLSAFPTKNDAKSVNIGHSKYLLYQKGKKVGRQRPPNLLKFLKCLPHCPPDSEGPASYLVQDTSALPTEDDAKRVNDGHRNAEKAHSGI